MMKPTETNPSWPSLHHFSSDALHRLAMPLGGIGTGTISLGGRGNLCDWEIMNTPAKGFIPVTNEQMGGGQHVGPFAALWCRKAGAPPVARCLESQLPVELYEGTLGCGVPSNGLPRFAEASFDAAYPLATIRFSDPDVPVQARLEAFNPMVPGDEAASSLPVAVLRYVLHNPTPHPIEASVCVCMPNFVGCGPDDWKPGFANRRTPVGGEGNVNVPARNEQIQGLLFTAPELDRKDPKWGTVALACLTEGVTGCRTQWNDLRWGGDYLQFWTQFSATGQVAEQPGCGQKIRPMGSLSMGVNLQPGETRAATFLIAWHFPNRLSWSNDSQGRPYLLGNHYTERFADAWQAAEHVARNLPELERRTLSFVRSFCESEVPAAIREAALFNSSTLRTQTCFQTPDSRFFGWEGCGDTAGCCGGSCTHVWNYENTLAHLFGRLSRTMREVEFAHAVDAEGAMSFRVGLPLDAGHHNGFAAADGQMGALVRLCRDWKLSGDETMLETLWPMAKKALEFCWIEGGWDADQDGVMEGCQHNTMDVEYFGPNPQMTGWYLAALRACSLMAEHLGESEFAGRCERLFQNGRAWMDEHLFNGEYYEHQVRPEAADGIHLPQIHAGMGAADPAKPDFQLANGCLVDQLVGQYMAHTCQLGYLHNGGHINTTLSSILRNNRRTRFYDHFNHMRSFALGDETALLMCSYPDNHRPDFPFPYYPEVMTGFEYVVAAGLIYEGRREEGLTVLQDIRARYDGRKRNPFNEAECGHHYARAMAAWTCLLAWTGFAYDATKGILTFRPSTEPVRWFWSNGTAFGMVSQEPGSEQITLRLNVIEGRIVIRELVLPGFGRVLAEGKQAVTGETTFIIPAS